MTMLQTANFSAKRFPYFYCIDASAYVGAFYYTYFGKEVPGFDLGIVCY